MTLKRKNRTQIEFKGVQRASYQAVIEWDWLERKYGAEII